MSAREGCPPWCTAKHSDPYDCIHVDIRQMSDGDSWVALTQDADGKFRIQIANHQTGQGTKSLLLDLDDAVRGAPLFARLGHEDIAAAVGELAALAAGELAESRH